MFWQEKVFPASLLIDGGHSYFPKTSLTMADSEPRMVPKEAEVVQKIASEMDSSL